MALIVVVVIAGFLTLGWWQNSRRSEGVEVATTELELAWTSTDVGELVATYPDLLSREFSSGGTDRVSVDREMSALLPKTPRTKLRDFTIVPDGIVVRYSVNGSRGSCIEVSASITTTVSLRHTRC